MSIEKVHSVQGSGSDRLTPRITSGASLFAQRRLVHAMLGGAFIEKLF